MKKRIIAMLTILAVFGLAVAAYAYTRNQTATTGLDKACCSKSADSCPMKAKGHDEKGEHAGMSCDKMKSHGSEHAMAEGHECCGSCGDACPMKKQEGRTAVASEGKSCCDACECCKAKTDKAV